MRSLEELVEMNKQRGEALLPGAAEGVKEIGPTHTLYHRGVGFPQALQYLVFVAGRVVAQTFGPAARALALAAYVKGMSQ